MHYPLAQSSLKTAFQFQTEQMLIFEQALIDCNLTPAKQCLLIISTFLQPE